ncbi:MAG: hypothetical protein P8016_16295 [Sedimentisphaerales bacterium]
MITELDARRGHLHAQIADLEKEKTRLHIKMKKLQKAMRNDLDFKWPQILHPYTAGFAQLMATDQDAIVSFIERQPHYQELVSAQNRLDKIKLDILHTHRKLTQYDKILRLRGLARELNEFRRFASPSIKADYTRLLKCEQLPL